MTAATWRPLEFTGAQPIEDTSTTAVHPLGFKIRANNDTYGCGEFIYLLGVASTVVGNLVTWNALTCQTTLAPDTVNLGQQVAVAMSANVASQYGWYQIYGAAVIKKPAAKALPNNAVFMSTTAGRVSTTINTSTQILGARTANSATITTTTSTVVVSICYPFIQGQII